MIDPQMPLVISSYRIVKIRTALESQFLYKERFKGPTKMIVVERANGIVVAMAQPHPDPSKREHFDLKNRV